MLVKKIRLQRGWSQQQLAELSGLSVRTIQRIESGQTANVETLKSLAAVFEIDFPQLAKESEMSNEPSFSGASASAKYSAEERLAFSYVRRLRSFYIGLMIYVLVIAGLAFINLNFSPGHQWFFWPAIIWGVILAVRAIFLFNVFPFFGADWEKRQIEKRLGRSL